MIGLRSNRKRSLLRSRHSRQPKAVTTAARARRECSLLELLSRQAVASMEEQELGKVQTRSNKIKHQRLQTMITTTVETRKSNMRL